MNRPGIYHQQVSFPIIKEKQNYLINSERKHFPMSQYENLVFFNAYNSEIHVFLSSEPFEDLSVFILKLNHKRSPRRGTNICRVLIM